VRPRQAAAVSGGLTQKRLHHERECANFTFQLQVKTCYCENMSRIRLNPKRRSGCPLNASVEMLGDRWSLLIIRDMMLRGFRSYKEFLESYEGIATNILADRLRRLEGYGVIATERDPSDGRKVVYSLTAKGIDLAPVMSEMVLWAAAHEDTGNPELVKELQKDKEGFVAAVRQRWAGKPWVPLASNAGYAERRRLLRRGTVSETADPD
jgi:DNA-binding HxlR family transcriptional regulator